MENRTARLTLLIDPQKKEVFEKLCDLDDVTPSQLIRKFIRDYIESHLGSNWQDQVFGTTTEGTSTAEKTEVIKAKLKE